MMLTELTIWGFAVFKVDFAEPQCNVENIPDSCLSNTNGIVEQRNPYVDILVIWRPNTPWPLTWIAQYINDGIGAQVDEALAFCLQDMPPTYRIAQSDLDGYIQCYSNRLGSTVSARVRYRAFAVWPASSTGRRASLACREGYMIVKDLNCHGRTQLTVILQPF